LYVAQVQMNDRSVWLSETLEAICGQHLIRVPKYGYRFCLRPAGTGQYSSRRVHFRDICPLDGAFEEVFRQRQKELDATLQQFEGEGVGVVVCARE
jgi:hypothetical protein